MSLDCTRRHLSVPCCYCSTSVQLYSGVLSVEAVMILECYSASERSTGTVHVGSYPVMCICTVSVYQYIVLDVYVFQYRKQVGVRVLKY